MRIKIQGSVQCFEAPRSQFCKKDSLALSVVRASEQKSLKQKLWVFVRLRTRIVTKIAVVSTSRKVLQKIGNVYFTFEKCISKNVCPSIDSSGEKLGTTYVSTLENWLSKL